MAGMFMQGIMFGYATDETEECMPLTIMLAHRLNAKIAELRRSGDLSWARPDTKTQVGKVTLLILKLDNTTWSLFNQKCSGDRWWESRIPLHDYGDWITKISDHLALFSFIWLLTKVQSISDVPDLSRPTFFLSNICFYTLCCLFSAQWCSFPATLLF